MERKQDESSMQWVQSGLMKKWQIPPGPKYNRKPVFGKQPQNLVGSAMERKFYMKHHISSVHTDQGNDTTVRATGSWITSRPGITPLMSV